MTSPDSNHRNTIYWLDILGMTIIGALSFGYFLFESTFAENHIALPFLNFPVFIGEIGIFLCLLLLAAKYFLRPHRITNWHWLVMGYFAFVAAKGLYGYITWGPLACRNAALLYYPICGVFGYAFFQRKLFHPIVNFGIICALLLPMWKGIFYDYWVFTAIIIVLTICTVTKSKRLKALYMALLLVFAPFTELFHSVRMIILGNTLAVIYLITMLAVLWKIPAKWKAGIIASLLIILTAFVYGIADRNELVSLVNLKKLAAIHDHYEDRYQRLKLTHQPYEFGQVKLFNPDNQGVQDYIKFREDIRQKTAGNNERDSGASHNTDGDKSDNRAGEPKPEISPDSIAGYANDGKIVTYNNAVYRLLVWRDLLEEYTQKRPLFGFDLGKPFRSKRLEVLRWGGQWKRDGWVPVHNSLLHIVYRSGIVGVSFIGAIIGLFVWLTRGFIRLRCMTGLLLLSTMVTWGVCANFLLTLEFPYTAVPVWSLYGMILAYYQLKLKEVRSNELEK